MERAYFYWHVIAVVCVMEGQEDKRNQSTGKSQWIGTSWGSSQMGEEVESGEDCFRSRFSAGCSELPEPRWRHCSIQRRSQQAQAQH